MSDFVLTPSQRRIFDLLRDGKRHTMLELKKAVYDEYIGNNNIAQQLNQIRKKIRFRGLEVICRLESKRIYYQLVIVYQEDE